MIKLNEITKSYGEKTVLGPINLTIERGGLTALIGPNGAGKSTMLTTIGRLIQPSSGTVTVGGHDIAATKPRELAKIVSILRQENHFLARLTVRQLVTFGRFPHSNGRITTADNTAIDKAIAFLELEQLQTSFIDELSGGQRQRAFVAMVLAQDTEYVLLDEPLAGLDMSHSVKMMQRLRLAADTLNKTIVIVIHDINFAAAYADNVVALAEGKLVAQGTPEEIITKTVLEKVFAANVTVQRQKIEANNTRPLAVYYRP